MLTKCQRKSFRFSSELGEKFISFSRKEQIEIEVTLFTIWVNLFYRYTGMEHIVVGMEMQGSHEKMIPLSIDISETNSFSDQVKEINKLLQKQLDGSISIRSN
jgi:hypothetical protein